MSVGGGREVVKTEFEREIEDALERLATGVDPSELADPRRGEAEAARHHASAISSRIQALASSELEGPPAPPEESFEGVLEDAEATPPPPLPPAAEEVTPPELELSWAYRQQLAKKEERPPPILFAATLGAIAGSLTTLIGVGVVLAMTRTRPPPGPERHLATAQVSAVQPRAPVAPPAISPPATTPPAAVTKPAPEATAAPEPVVEPPREIPAPTSPAPQPTAHPPPAATAIGSSRPSTWGPRTSARARFKQALPRAPARASNAGKASAAEADEDGERVLSDSEMESNFEKAYGGSGAAGRDGRPTVYIPPRPNVPDLLTEGDILQVVLAHKPQILGCLKGHSPGEAPGEKRTLTMRWNIEPDGRTSAVAIATSALEDSPVGNCLAEQIATWRFPPHRKAQPTVRFPFTY